MLTVGAGSEVGMLGAILEQPVNSNDNGRQDRSATDPARRETERGTRSHPKLLFLPGLHEKRRSDALSRIVSSKFNRSISPHKLISITLRHYGSQIEAPQRPTEFCIPFGINQWDAKSPKQGDCNEEIMVKLLGARSIRCVSSLLLESKRRAKLPCMGMGVSAIRRRAPVKTQRFAVSPVDPQRFPSAIGTWRALLPILLFRGIRRVQCSNRLEVRMLIRSV